MINKTAVFDISAKVVGDARLASNLDMMEKFELSLPFDNISIGGLNEILNELNVNDYVDFDQFKERISRDNQVWRLALLDNQTITSKILLSSLFHPAEKPGKISVPTLLSLALLHCPSSKKDSAKVFYQVV